MKKALQKLKPPSKRFLVDTGCSSHIVNSDENFLSVDEEFKPGNHSVTLANGKTTVGLALKKGSIEVLFQDSKGNMVKGKLDEVLFMPSYPQNIFSVRKATKNGSHAVFHHYEGELVTANGTKFGFTAEGEDDLWYLQDLPLLSNRLS